MKLSMEWLRLFEFESINSTQSADFVFYQSSLLSDRPCSFGKGKQQILQGEDVIP